MEKILKTYFGYQSFRPKQKEIIEAIIAKKDTMSFFATGFGKSLCFILPALITNKVVVVICPLISLMQDQVNDLVKRDIKACFLGSHQTDSKIIKGAFAGEYNIIYITPEKLSTSYEQFVKIKDKICLFAVDEAHCISKWGHDFRKSYLQLCLLRECELSKIPIATFTATATMEIRKFISQNLKLRNPVVFCSSFNRPNLCYHVSQVSDNCVENVLAKHEYGSVIIYATEKKTCDSMYSKLSKKGFNVGLYHGDISANTRKIILKKFLDNDINIIIATEAFGMGINKPDVYTLINFGLPKSIEAYFQQSGRAGRDGEQAHCYLFYKRQEFVRKMSIIDTVTGKKKFKAVMRYTDQNIKCRRKYLLKYLGESFDDNVEYCCDLCAPTTYIPEHKIIETFGMELKLLVQCIREMQIASGCNYGVTMVKNIICGKIPSNAPSRVERLSKLNCFGSGKSRTKKWWGHLIQLSILIDNFICRTNHGGLKVHHKYNNHLIIRENVDTLALFDILQNNKKCKGKPSATQSFPKKSKTMDVTLALCNEGKSISEIALARGMKAQTISKHIANLVKAGRIDKTQFVTSDIIDAVEQLDKSARLRTIRDQLKRKFNLDIDYDIIQIAIA